ncbi:CocE/NonD family hydrolase [Nonomuraea sp. B19D2]|uniref:CocE/NonD family hydrolase n=1 Tax=Nonomuraea sp. B19D2 TaxID=3159561 RepID=UPI0032DAFA2F
MRRRASETPKDPAASLLGTDFGVLRRDVEIPAADGVRLLATHYYPADVDKAPLVLLRSPYGRGNALDQLPKLLAERGYQVLYQSLRGTAGSGGRFDGSTIDPADADGTLSWLRAQPWFGGVPATWGASYLGFTQWELAAREIPEWKIALIQDAPAEFGHRFMYPGGAFALVLCQVQRVEVGAGLGAGRGVMPSSFWAEDSGVIERPGMALIVP